MKVRDLLALVKKGNVEAASKVAYFCRFRFGWNYQETFDFVHDRTGIDLATWDTLLEEVEYLGY